MLARLSIRDIVLIDQLDLEFSHGLTILTGETGAGKSILLDSLSLALGARGDGALVRHGQAQGQVTATFDLPPDHRAFQALAGQEIPADGELIFRRVQLADGRTRAFINDQSVSAQTLRAVAADLVEIHGQHDERALLDASTHRALVDAYGGHEALTKATRAAFASLREVEAELASERARVAAAQAAADFARHAHEELTRLDVKPGEEEALAERRARMMQGEKVAADIREAHQNLSGDAAILPVLSAIARRLQRRMPQAPALIEPSVLALGRGDGSAGSRDAGRRKRARRLRLRSARTRAMRGAPVRAAGHGAQIRDARRRPCPRSRKNTPTNWRTSARARSGWRRSKARRARRPALTPRPRRRCRTRARTPRANWSGR